MSANRVCLTLLAPRALEDTLVDAILANAGDTAGFTVTSTDAVGPMFALRGDRELVRGRSERIRIDTLLDEPDARALLDQLRATVRADVRWWLAPVLAEGTLS